MGWFTRYVADDFCMTNAYHTHGLFGSVWFWYRNWSGRWAHFLAVNLAEAAGRWTVRIIPALLIAVLVAALAWVFVQVGRRLGAAHPVPGAIMAAEALAVALLAGVRQQFLSVYWRPGVIAYLVPWILLALASGVVVRSGAPGDRRRLIAAASLAFVAGSFTETQTTVQIAALGLASLWSIRAARPATRNTLIAMCAASVAALLVLATAPGNGPRLTKLPGPLGPVETLAASGRMTGAFLAESFGIVPWRLVLAALTGAALGAMVAPRRLRGPLMLTPAGTLAVVYAAMVPSAYTGVVAPTARLFIIPEAALVAGLFLTGVLAGNLAAGGRAGVIASVAVAAVALAVVPSLVGPIVEERRVASEYARAADARDDLLKGLRAGGVRQARIDILPAYQRRWVGGLDPMPQPQQEINSCFAAYYGFETLVARVP